MSGATNGPVPPTVGDHVRACFADRCVDATILSFAPESEPTVALSVPTADLAAEPFDYAALLRVFRQSAPETTDELGQAPASHGLLFTGYVERVVPEGDGWRVEAAARVDPSRSRLGRTFFRLSPPEMFWFISRISGFSPGAIHVQSAGWPPPPETWLVVMPVRGIRPSTAVRVGDVVIAAETRLAQAFADASPDLRDSFASTGVWAFVPLRAATAFEAERTGRVRIERAVNRLALLARYAVSTTPSGEVRPFRMELIEHLDTLPIIGGHAPQTGRAWLRDVQLISDPAELTDESLRGLEPSARAADELLDLAVAAWRRATRDPDPSSAIVALIEALEFYVGKTQPESGPFSRAQRRELRRRIGMDWDPQQRGRIDWVLARLNDPSYGLLLETALAADGVQLSEEEKALLTVIREIRNDVVHGRERRELPPDELRRALALVGRILVFRSHRLARETTELGRSTKPPVAGDWTQTALGPGLTVAEWLELRDALAPQTYDIRWERAIRAIERRFALRFTEPADALLALDEEDVLFPAGRGFAILALDCLVIEMLYGYRRGTHTQSGETRDAFDAFVSDEPTFTKDASLTARIPSFARAIRNGLLHDGETREGWIVWKGRADGPLAQALSDDRVVLYRDAFHAAACRRLDSYFAELRGSGAGSTELRSRFRERVDQLCRDSAPPGAQRRASPSRWQAEPMPRWSFDQLAKRDDRIMHFLPDGLGMGLAMTEKGSWAYVQSMVASSNLRPEVPEAVRRQCEAVCLLHVYGYFQADFFSLVHGEASLAMELALRLRFIQEYPERVTLRRGKTGATAELPIRSYDDLADAFRVHGTHPAREGWRLDGSSDFDGSLRGLYLWALERGYLRSFLEPIWRRAQPGIAMDILIRTEDRGLPKPPPDFAVLPPDQRERWWEEAYRPAWEIAYLENEVDLRNAHAHPTGSFNRMPNYSASSVGHLFTFVNGLFTPVSAKPAT